MRAVGLIDSNGNATCGMTAARGAFRHQTMEETSRCEMGL